MKRRKIRVDRIYRLVAHPNDNLFDEGHPLRGAKLQLHQVGWQSLGISASQYPDGSLRWRAFFPRFTVLSGRFKGQVIELPHHVRLHVIKQRPDICNCDALHYPHRRNSIPECKYED